VGVEGCVGVTEAVGTVLGVGVGPGGVESVGVGVADGVGVILGVGIIEGVGLGVRVGVTDGVGVPLAILQSARSV